MRTYVSATGIVFVLILAAHVARLFAEGSGPLTQPVFVLTSLLSLGFSVWAWCLLRRPSPPDGRD